MHAGQSAVAVGHRHRVLLVEDDPDCREAAQAALEIWGGYEVVTAADGQQALERIREERDAICVIVLDLMLPAKSGFWFRAKQLADAEVAAVPVIIVSGMHAIEQRAQELGCRHFLQKPTDPQDLLRMVGVCCQRV